MEMGQMAGTEATAMATAKTDDPIHGLVDALNEAQGDLKVAHQVFIKAQAALDAAR